MAAPFAFAAIVIETPTTLNAAVGVIVTLSPVVVSVLIVPTGACEIETMVPERSAVPPLLFGAFRKSATWPDHVYPLADTIGSWLTLCTWPLYVTVFTLKMVWMILTNGRVSVVVPELVGDRLKSTGDARICCPVVLVSWYPTLYAPGSVQLNAAATVLAETDTRIPPALEVLPGVSDTTMALAPVVVKGESILIPADDALLDAPRSMFIPTRVCAPGTTLVVKSTLTPVVAPVSVRLPVLDDTEKNVRIPEFMDAFV
jgi:hypothetical protein